MGEKLKRIYGVSINYRLMNDFLSNIGDIRKARKANDVGAAFEKRIMLAVTQVNGCRMCSYFHTREALKIGMPEQEIRDILGGELRGAPEEETAALAFAQHYADTAGHYDPAAWERIVRTYGEARARSILAYIRAIMVGNAQGNILGALKSRFRGRPEPNSTFFKELAVLFSDIFIIPYILIKAPGIKAFKKIAKRRR
ncbi:MAG: carboxymuconolactone decarboxylase family protein [Eubacteriales bacterium]|nr:carboxymuconolactone decarboxylase family protein [Eubacteriales bacterium]